MPKEDSNYPAPLCGLIRVFIVRMKKFSILGYPKCASEDSDQTARTQVDLNLRWSNTFEFMLFSDVVAH